MNIGLAIKMARVKKGLKQKELAALADVSPTYLSLVENDKRDPSFGLVVRIAKELQFPLTYLIFLAEEKDKGPNRGLNTIFAEALSSLFDKMSHE